MKVLFVYTLRDVLTPKRPLASLSDIHIGISYVSSFLKTRGHQTRLVVLGSETPARSFNLLDTTVQQFNPRLIAFTAVSTQFPFVREAAARLKRRWPEKFLLLGGAHASLAPEDAIQSDFDGLCVGEGEQPTAELAEQLEHGRWPARIPNLWLKQRDGTVEPNPPRRFLEDLDSLPLLDREMWQEWVMATRQTGHVLLPSRGCPYNCSYCSNHALRKLAPGRYVRFRSPADVVREVQCVKKAYPEASHIYLQSETLVVNAEWLEELAKQLSEFNAELPEPIAFTTNFRVARHFLNERTFHALARANVKTLEIGLESGSERVRSEVLRRHYSNEEFFRAVTLAREFGMEVNVYNMIGLPGETVAEHAQTIEVNHQVCPNRSLTSIFFPYPGTDLFETCKRQGLLPKAAGQTAERFRALIGSPEFSRKQIQRAYDWFEYRVYQGHRPWHYRLRKVLRNKAYSHPWSHAVFTRLLPLWYQLRAR